MIKSWKTTVTGLLQFLVILWAEIQFLLDTDPLTNPDWSLIAASLFAFIGLLTARDNDVSSEAAGVPGRETESQRASRTSRG